MFQVIDNYCERLGSAFWAEPVNAITNVAFIVAGAFGWRLMTRLSAQSTGHRVLVAIICTIGVGSFLFHTFATRWAELADIIPILMFQICFLWLYSLEVMGLSRLWAGVLMVGFLVVVWIGFNLKAVLGIAPDAPSPLNGSEMYIGAFLGILGLALYHAFAAKKERYLLLVALLGFCLSLTFRTLDMALCRTWPMGTHFLWHLFNAGVVYLSLRALLLNDASEQWAREEYQSGVNA